jgi:hypothetical protein
VRYQKWENGVGGEQVRLSFPHNMTNLLIYQIAVSLVGSVERVTYDKMIAESSLAKNFVDLPEFNLINNHIHFQHFSLDL